MASEKKTLSLKKLGIDTYKDSVIYMRQDCHICASEGFEARSRVRVDHGGRSIIATLNIITSDILGPGEVGLSEYAWLLLGASDGGLVTVGHAKHVSSLSYVRAKIYGHTLSTSQIKEIISDIAAGRYSDIYLSSFLTACAGNHMADSELIDMTNAMVEVGKTLDWETSMVVDKHCVGGLPGNRTTPIIVPIVAAFGLTMPKTSSRAITSPAGTADMMEVLAPVEMDVSMIKRVVKEEGGCIVWGGAVSLSPADDIIIGVERALSLDSESQLVSSILSKKIAAGSTHLVIDIPIGPTAKVRSAETAQKLKKYFESIGEALGLKVRVVFGDGTQPIGRGIGPALEARDVVSVLRGDQDAPQDLRARAITLAGCVLEFSPNVERGRGAEIATGLLNSGQAWDKFQAICRAQGGMREIPKAAYTHPYTTKDGGRVVSIDNRRLALIAKLAGAPQDETAGIDLHVSVGSCVHKNDVLFTIHAQSPGELQYALDYVSEGNDVMVLEE
ncbi:thymidine phosphorylase family protein [Candidatus Dependentiae bacterium]|nr:thymidine phosphorylase family protein [Candidatus Dependentiae bacterium]